MNNNRKLKISSNDWKVVDEKHASFELIRGNILTNSRELFIEIDIC